MTSTGRENIRRNDVHDADLGLKIPARYRHDWALFADWCTAADHRTIPADQHPGTHLLRHHLTDPIDIDTDPLDAEQARQPLLCPIDRWGHLPHAQPMTPQSVSTLVRAHLSGRAPVRRVLPVPLQDDLNAGIEHDIDLDYNYYDHGTAARRRDHQTLKDLTDVFDEIEARAKGLLEDLMGVLEGL